MAFRVGQVLRDGQRDPRGEDPFDDRIVRGIEQQHQLAGGGPLFQPVTHVGEIRVGQTHRRKDDPEGPAAGGGLRRDLSRQRQVGQAGNREDGQLLPPDQGGQGIDDGDPRQDRFGRWLSLNRVKRPAADRHGGGAGHRRASVQRFSAAVADAAQPVRSHWDMQWTAREPDPDPPWRHTVGAFQNLKGDQVLVHLQHQPMAILAVSHLHRGELVPANAVNIAQDQQGAAQLPHIAMGDLWPTGIRRARFRLTG